MIAHTKSKSLSPLVWATVVTLGLLGAGLARANDARAAKAAPVKLVLNTHGFVGWKVKEVSAWCGTSTGAECQEGEESGEPGGFAYPTGVAVAAGGDVYVADNVNNRVQELDPSEPAGKQFVLMFGKEVNKDGASVCTSTEESMCRAGTAGGGAGSLSEPQDVAVEATTGDIYVLDHTNWRIDKFSASGEFLLMFGKDVNTSGGNICTKAEEAQCKSGVKGSPESNEEGSFAFVGNQGDLLSLGGTAEHEHVLYVADAHRVEEFGPQGEWFGQIGLASETIANAPQGHLTALAFNAGTVFAVYNYESTIHEFDAATGEESQHEISVASEGGSSVTIRAIAIDAGGHLAVSAAQYVEGQTLQFGSLYEAADGERITGFTVAGRQEVFGVVALAFATNAEKQMYAVTFRQDVMSYVPKPVAEAVTLSQQCESGPEHQTDVTFDCTLNGEVDPWGVSGTTAWFEWGRAATLGEKTEPQPIANAHQPPTEGEEEPYAPISAEVREVRPNESSFYYRVVALDGNVLATELLPGETVSFTTPVAPPAVIGRPTPRFIGPTSAVLFGELNPENTSTAYQFQYAPVAACRAHEASLGREVTLAECPGMRETAQQVSAIYGKVGAGAEVTGLLPATGYRYGLQASNAGGGATGGEGGEFQTLAAPVVEVVTGDFSAVTSSSATIYGTFEPDGEAATYTFELGVDEGSGTEYDLVSSGSLAPTNGFVAKSLELTGLQPGTTYAYRAGIHFGDGSTTGSSAVGAAQTFTTLGVANVLEPPASPPMLASPAGLMFPTSPPPKPKRLTNSQKLAKALAACRKQTKRKRVSCDRLARKRYGKKSSVKRRGGSSSKAHRSARGNSSTSKGRG